jgi:1-acyl-sn-glycerol-3-phosphate acyltransferase
MVILKGIYTIYAWTLWILMGFWAFFWAMIVTIIRGKKGIASIVMGYKIFAWCWCFCIGLRIKTKGANIRDNSEPCIIISNHGSTIDMMTAPYVLPTKVTPLAKAELKKIPMLGFMFKAASIFVDRKDPESRKRSMEEMKQALQNGVYIFMYPEGTRNRTKNPLKEFYDGAFRTSIELQKPIMPLVILNVRKVAPMGTFLMQPGKLIAEYLEPIPTAGLTEADVPALKEKIFQLMYHYIETNDPYYIRKRSSPNGEEKLKDKHH